MKQKKSMAARIEAFIAPAPASPVEDTSDSAALLSSQRREIEDAFGQYRRQIDEIRVRNGRLARRSLSVGFDLN